jgi:hypothetical protein
MQKIDQQSEPDRLEFVALREHTIHNEAIKMLIQRGGGVGALRYTTLGRSCLCILIF